MLLLISDNIFTHNIIQDYFGSVIIFSIKVAHWSKFSSNDYNRYVLLLYQLYCLYFKRSNFLVLMSC